MSTEGDPAAEAAAYQRCVATSLALGRAGGLRLQPEIFWLPVSENCNLRCIGCDDVVTGFRKAYISPDEARRLLTAGAGDASFAEIDLTSGEPLLHPQLAELIDICHALHPEARVSVVTNGTVPVRGKYREAYARLDSIGLSIDGATAEVFEAIRVGASFPRFVQTVQDLVALRRETGRPAQIQLCFTACALNLHQLADVVRLGHAWGVDSVYAQTMEMNIAPIQQAIGHLHLDRMDPAERSRLVDEAQAVAAALGIELSASEGLYPLPPAPLPGPSAAFEARAASLGVGVTRRNADGQPLLAATHVRQCQYPWTQAPGIRKTAAGDWQLTVCCYMTEAGNRLVQDRYALGGAAEHGMLDLFNGPGYWQLREDLAAGLTREVCGDCAAALTHPPSLLQHLGWRLEALAREHGLPFPGGEALRHLLQQSGIGPAQARRVRKALREEWLTRFDTPPEWLQAVMQSTSELLAPGD
ncbi:MAG TPA: radical SAM protein [Ideonella sp.]|uniref:radical SAM protein n=1 Tax=Ideonella sp. TaxID=1929293 RepID=UPI002B8F13EC|nr:radical SAM protein [Ideonella sp.]HSI50728.1 radical SAM protein [Ideonella sp.]